MENIKYETGEVIETYVYRVDNEDSGNMGAYLWGVGIVVLVAIMTVVYLVKNKFGKK